MELIKQKKALEIIGVTAMTLRGYSKSNKIKVIKQAGQNYYNQEDVLKLKETLDSKKKSEPKKEVEEPLKKEPETDFSELEILISKIQNEDSIRKRSENKKVFELLEREPPKHWLKPIENEFTNDGKQVMVLPIDKVEFLLSYIFSEWYSEITRIQQVFKDSIIITVKVHYLDMFGIWRSVEGIAATKISREEDVKKEIPATEARAIINACKRLGKIFGRDINRDVKVPVKVKKNKKEAIFYDLKNKIKSAKDFSELESIKEAVKEDEDLIKLYNEKEFELFN